MNLLTRIKQAVVKRATKPGVFATFLSYFYPISNIDPKRYYTSWVFAAINTIAEQVSTIDIKLQKINKKGEWEDVLNHPSLDLLKRVNPEMTSSQLFYSVPAWCESEGNAFWYIAKSANNTPVEIWPLDSTRMNINTDADGYVIGYTLMNEKGQEVKFERDEVIHFKRFNINSRHRGIGTLQAVALEAETDRNAAAYNRNFFDNNGMPGATLETDKELNDEQLTKIITQWRQKYTGIENAGKTALLHSGIKFKPTTITQKDMQYLEGRKYSRDTILAIYRVPTVLVGILENANRANIEGAEYIFAKYRIKPYMDFIVDPLNEFYLFMWNLDPAQYRYTLAVDPVPENAELELKKKQAAYGKWLTANEIRADEGMEDREDGDVLANPAGGFGSVPIEEEEATKSKKKTLKKAAKDPIIVGRETILEKYTSKSKKKYAKFLDKTLEDLKEKLGKQKSFKPEPIKIKLNKTSEMLHKMQVLQRRKAQGDDLANLLFEDWDKYISILFDSIKDDYEISMAYGGKVALQRVDVGIRFDMENERAQAWIEDTGLKNATSIVGTLKDDLRGVILDAVKEGEGAQVIADRLQEHYSLMEDWKALQIARTELTNGYSQGNLEGYRQSDVVEGIEWFVGGEGNDEACGGNSGVVIPLDGTFPSGHDAPPAHPNCECTALPIVKND